MTASLPDPDRLIRTACDGILKDPTGYPSALYHGEVVYFCTRACRRAFETDPDRFMAGEIEHPLHEDPLDADGAESGAKEQQDE